MGRQKKQITYIFNDQEVTVPSMYIAKCTLTHEEVPIYHKHLAKLVEDKYKGNWAYFLKHYKKRGAVEQIKEAVIEQSKKDDPNFTEESQLNQYSKYLEICWRTEQDKLKTNQSPEQKVKSQQESARLAEVYLKRFKKDISKGANAK